jgi:hypothetical protein
MSGHTEFATGLKRLGLAGPDAGQGIAELVDLRAAGECAPVHRRMTELVDARLAQVEAELTGALAEQAAAGGLAGTVGTEPIRRGIPLMQTAARLQAAIRILAEPASNAGGCSDGCACSQAAAATDAAYVLPNATGTASPALTSDGLPIVCTLETDGGNMAERAGEWQAVIAQATGQERVDDGVALTFPHDINRTAQLARPLAAEFSCCSFASYHLIIDSRGVRLEIRTPPEAQGAFDAMFGFADHPGAAEPAAT